MKNTKLETNRRIVITGIGVVSPLGLNAQTTWQALIQGKSGISRITQFDAAAFETKIAGEVKDFDPCIYMNPKEARHMDRFAQFAVSASRQALTESELMLTTHNCDDVGAIIGSSLGGIDTLYGQSRILLEKGPERLSPFLMPMMATDMAAAQVSILLGLRGINFSVSSACATGTDAIGLAYELIREGRLSVILAGGSEAAVNPICIGGYNALKALSTRNETPETASRPFDATRDGFVVSEGAAVLVLEEASHALSRGAKIIAEIAGYGATSDAYHITHPTENGEGGVRAMKMALEKAGLKPDDVDYINAHGTSTPVNDRIETKAIKQVFDRHAYRLAVSSTKSMTGHLIGAAGAIEVAFCALTICDGIIPPTMNLHHPDPECDLDYVPNEARRGKVKVALSNSFGFGGHNSTIIVREFEG